MEGHKINTGMWLTENKIKLKTRGKKIKKLGEEQINTQFLNSIKQNVHIKMFKPYASFTCSI